MGNKITKNVSVFDDNMHQTKLSKRKSVQMVDAIQKNAAGGSFGPVGQGTYHDPEREAKQKNYAKADYLEPPERTLDDVMAGTPMPDPVKKPTMKNIGTVEPTKKYLGHFANDDVVQAGHNVSQKGIMSYKGEGRGNT